MCERSIGSIKNKRISHPPFAGNGWTKICKLIYILVMVIMIVWFYLYIISYKDMIDDIVVITNITDKYLFLNINHNKLYFKCQRTGQL